MLTPEFDYHSPVSFNEASTLLSKLQSETKDFILMAGGTDVMPSLKRLGKAASAVISLKDLPGLSEVTLKSDQVLRVGALARLADVVSHPLVVEKLDVVGKTASKIASPQIRNQATLGGNLLVDNRCRYFNQAETDRESQGSCFKAGGEICHLIPRATKESSPVCRARFVSDLAPVLILLGASLNFVGPDGERKVLLKDFYPADGIYHCKSGPQEILTTVDIPLEYANQVAYRKLRIRETIDFPSLGVALKKELKNDRLFLSICLTGVDTHPVCFELDEALLGSKEKVFEQLERLTKKSVTALKQDFFPPLYRKQMITVFVKEMLES